METLLAQLQAMAAAAHAGVLSMNAHAWAAVSAVCAAALFLLLQPSFLHKGRPTMPEYPIVGALPFILSFREKLTDGILQFHVRIGNLHVKPRTWSARWLGSPRYWFTADPAVVEHVLKTNFEGYVKGSLVRGNLSDLLGRGIFTADGGEWKEQRRAASHMFSLRGFRETIMDAFVAHAPELVGVLDEAAASTRSARSSSDSSGSSGGGKTARNTRKSGSSDGNRSPASAPQDPSSGDVVNVPSPVEVDMASLFHRFTLDSIGDIAFGDNIGSLRNPDQPFSRAFDGAQAIVEHRFITPLWGLTEWLNGDRTTLNASVKVINSYAQGLIDKRRAAGDYEGRRDVLSRFMALKDEATGAPLHTGDDGYLRDVVMNFAIAGRDTTAQALSWATLMIASHPAVQARLVQEAQALLTACEKSDGGSTASAAAAGQTGVRGSGSGTGASHGRPSPSTSSSSSSSSNSSSSNPYARVTHDAVSRDLPYTHAVVLETLRLFPSVPKDVKVATADDTWPDGTVVKAGEVVAWSPFSMGRSQALWGPDAEDFRPERWLAADGSVAKPSPFRYPSFNAGPRTCLGQQMALVEACFVLAVLHARYVIRLAPDVERAVTRWQGIKGAATGTHGPAKTQSGAVVAAAGDPSIPPATPVPYVESLTLPLRDGLRCVVALRAGVRCQQQQHLYQ